MTTSKPSQPALFAVGSENEALFDPTPLWPTPAVKDTGRDVASYMAMKRGMPGGERRTITQLTTAVQAGSISSPEAIPASHSLSPGSDWARRMTAISGRSLLPLLRTSNPVDACLRTLLDTSRWGSTRCWLTWKKSATPAGRLLFRLVPSAPRTGAIGSGFSQSMWPTPDVGMTQGGRSIPEGTSETGKTPDGRKVQVGLTNAVKLYPTPTANDAKNASLPPAAANPNSLPGMILRERMLPTPTSQMAKHSDPTEWEQENRPAHANVLPGGKLSAAWVSRLMGYPDGWLDLAD